MFDKYSNSPMSDASFEDLFVGSGPEKIEIPELGGKAIYLRQLSAAEMREFVISQRDNPDGQMSRESFQDQDRMIAQALVDANGNRFVPEGQESRLSTLPYKVYLRLVNAVTAGMSGTESGSDGGGDVNPT